VQIEPCIPHDWAGYTVRYRRGNTLYVIRVQNPLRISTGDVAIELDGRAIAGNRFTVTDDAGEHRVDVQLLEPGSALSGSRVDEREADVSATRR